jgi:PAS domain S-box-containing protein
MVADRGPPVTVCDRRVFSGGYDDTVIRSLGPLVSACSVLITAHRNDRRAREVDDGAGDRPSRLQAALDAAADGIITLDDSGTVETLNPAAARMFGYRPDEVVGRNVSVLSAEAAGVLSGAADSVLGRGREVVGRRRDGSAFPAHLSLGEFRVGDRRKFTGVLHDLTERQAASAGLRENRIHTTADRRLPGRGAGRHRAARGRPAAPDAGPHLREHPR